MVIDLLNLQPQTISKNLRGKFIMLYGLPGVGKTTLASKFDKVIIAGFEMGTNALNNVYVQPLQSWSDWKRMVNQLCKNPDLKEKFHSVAIDTADEAWKLCTQQVCADAGVENLGDVPFGKLYDVASREYHKTFRDLTMNGYGIIFISHSTEKTFKNEKGEDYTLLAPALPNRPFDIVNKMVDIIAYIREVSNEAGERRRYMFLRDEVGDRFLAKSRFKYIVPRIELDYNALVNAIYDAIDKEVENSGGTATDESNPYIQLDFDSLMEEARMLWGKVTQAEKLEEASKILETVFGKPKKFSEILPAEVEELNKVLIDIRAMLD